MSLIDKMIKKAVVKKIEDVATYGYMCYVENTRSVNAIINHSTAKYLLFIKKKDMSLKNDFNVYDENDSKRYIIKKDMFSFEYPCMRLYDTMGKEIGCVELTEKDNDWACTISLDGKKLGTVTHRISPKLQLDVNFNGWHINGNLMQNNFVVTDMNENCTLIINDAFSSKAIYVLEMNSQEYEIFSLLLVMTIDIARQTIK